MSAVPTAAALERRAEPLTAPELCVVVACQSFVCAIPTKWVRRLLLPDEVTSLAPPVARAAEASLAKDTTAAARVEAPRLVRVAGDPFVAWNLGLLLDAGPSSAAWVILDLPQVRDGRAVGPALPIALATDACLTVRTVTKASRVPAQLFRARGNAFAYAFETSKADGAAVQGLTGLMIDPEKLFRPDELRESMALLARHEARRTRP